MNVRLATAADIPAMIDLERQCPTAAHWTEGQYLAALPACGAGLTSRLVLVVDHEEETIDGEGRALANADLVRESTLAGFLVARHQGPEWELENMVVAAASRRKGLGTRLLKKLLSRAQGAGSECVLLEVRESNRAAAFYEKHGFEETGRRRAYYSNPEEDAIVYQQKLLGSK